MSQPFTCCDPVLRVHKKLLRRRMIAEKLPHAQSIGIIRVEEALAITMFPAISPGTFPRSIFLTLQRDNSPPLNKSRRSHDNLLPF